MKISTHINIVAWREVPQDNVDNFMTHAIENYIDIYNKDDNEETYKKESHPISLPLKFELSENVANKVNEKLSNLYNKGKFYSVAILYYLGMCEIVKYKNKTTCVTILLDHNVIEIMNKIAPYDQKSLIERAALDYVDVLSVEDVKKEYENIKKCNIKDVITFYTYTDIIKSVRYKYCRMMSKFFSVAVMRMAQEVKA